VNAILASAVKVAIADERLCEAVYGAAAQVSGIVAIPAARQEEVMNRWMLKDSPKIVAQQIEFGVRVYRARTCGVVCA
jgi:hypothetical protein